MMTRHAHMETEDKKGLGHAFFRLSSWYYFVMLFPTMRMRVRCSLWTWLWNSLEKGAASMPGGLAKHMRNSPMQDASAQQAQAQASQHISKHLYIIKQ